MGESNVETSFYFNFTKIILHHLSFFFFFFLTTTTKKKQQVQLHSYNSGIV